MTRLIKSKARGCPPTILLPPKRISWLVSRLAQTIILTRQVLVISIFRLVVLLVRFCVGVGMARHSGALITTQLIAHLRVQPVPQPVAQVLSPPLQLIMLVSF